MQTDETETGERLQKKDEGVSASRRVVDPSEAVTGMGFVLGVIGVAVGTVAALFISPLTWAVPIYCVIAALAGGSAGVVIGGLIGAVFAVLRGVTVGNRVSRQRTQ